MTGRIIATVSMLWWVCFSRSATGTAPPSATIGIALGVGGGEPGHQVRAARARRHQHDAGLAGEAAQAAGDEGGVLLVAADHRLDLRIDQRVEHRIDLGAGDAEDILDALRLEVLDQELARRSFALIRRGWWLLRFASPAASISSNTSFMVISALVAAGKPQ